MKIKWYGKEVAEAVEKGINKGLEVVALDMHREAVRNAEKSVDTGRLRASIAYSVDGGTPAGFSSVPTSKDEDTAISSNDKMAVVGTNVEYARRIEYGGSKRQGPEGYLRPAYDVVQPKAHETIQEYITKELKR